MTQLWFCLYRGDSPPVFTYWGRITFVKEPLNLRMSNPFSRWPAVLPAADESLIFIYNWFILHSEIRSDCTIIVEFLSHDSLYVLSGLPCYGDGRQLGSVPLIEHQTELGVPHWARNGGEYRADATEGPGGGSCWAWACYFYVWFWINR